MGNGAGARVNVQRSQEGIGGAGAGGKYCWSARKPAGHRRCCKGRHGARRQRKYGTAAHGMGAKAVSQSEGCKRVGEKAHSSVTCAAFIGT